MFAGAERDPPVTDIAPILTYQGGRCWSVDKLALTWGSGEDLACIVSGGSNALMGNETVMTGADRLGPIVPSKRHYC